MNPRVEIKAFIRRKEDPILKRDQDIWSVWWRGQGEKDCYRCGLKGHLARSCGAYGRKVQEKDREQRERTQVRPSTYAEKAGGQQQRVDMFEKEVRMHKEAVAVAVATEKESSEEIVDRAIDQETVEDTIL